MMDEVYFEHRGECPICETEVLFTAENDWFRDHLLCPDCGSIPRERALMAVIQELFPDWRDLRIHESSPVARGASRKLSEATHYVASQYDPALPPGATSDQGWIQQDLEDQTFEDESFDLVVSQDVFEHIFDIDAAFREIARTLKPGGAHVFTTPLVRKGEPTIPRAVRDGKGGARHLAPPEYHGNPVDPGGSLVTWHFGYDLATRAQEVAGTPTLIFSLDCIDRGIRAEHNEVLVSRKPDKAGTAEEARKTSRASSSPVAPSKEPGSAKDADDPATQEAPPVPATEADETPPAFSSRSALWLSPSFGLVPLLWKVPIWLLRGTFGIRFLWWRQARHLVRSGEFDTHAYLRRNPDVASAGLDPVYHYVRFGWMDDAFEDQATTGERSPSHEPAESEDPDLAEDHPELTPRPTVSGPWGGESESQATEPGRSPSPPIARWKWNERQLERRREDATPLLFVSHDAARAGAQIYLLEVLKSFSRRPDLELYVLLLTGGELESAFEDLAHVFLATEARENGDVSETTILAALEGMPSAPRTVLSNTVASSMAAKVLASRGHPVVSIVHELPTTIESLGVETIYDTVDASHRVIIVSRFVKRRLLEAFDLPSSKLEVVYVGVTGWRPETEGEPEAARREIFARHGLPEEALLVLGCGSVHQRKGPDLFVQAAASALRDYGVEDTYFLWVGGDQSGPLVRSWCEHDIEALGLSDRIFFAGQQASTLEYYQAADVFLLTSREDPFPLVNLEALARGLPIVAFEDAGGASEALTEDAGLVVPYLDITEMTRALVRLIEAPRYRAELGERALARAHERFRWERFVDELLEILLSSADTREARSNGDALGAVRGDR